MDWVDTRESETFGEVTCFDSDRFVEPVAVVSPQIVEDLGKAIPVAVSVAADGGKRLRANQEALFDPQDVPMALSQGGENGPIRTLEIGRAV
jgi:hypothetical protein